MPLAHIRVNSHLRPYETSASPAIQDIIISGHTRHSLRQAQSRIFGKNRNGETTQQPGERSTSGQRHLISSIDLTPKRHFQHLWTTGGGRAQKSTQLSGFAKSLGEERKRKWQNNSATVTASDRRTPALELKYQIAPETELPVPLDDWRRPSMAAAECTRNRRDATTENDASLGKTEKAN